MQNYDYNAYNRANIPQVAYNKSSVYSGFQNPAIHNADSIKSIEPFFGPVENSNYLLNQDTTFKRNYQLPYAYPSRHLPYVSTVILGLTIDTSDFLTREPYGCPIQHTTDQVFEWNEIIFDESTLDYVPEEGIPTILRSAETKQRATISRRGKAMLLEHGFHFSPAGQVHYVRQIQQISNAIALTMSQSTLREMVRTLPKQMKYLSDLGKFNKPTREILAHFYDNFAPCQRMNKGLQSNVFDGINIIRDRGYSPNMLIVPQGGECFFNLQASDYNLKQFSGVDVAIPTGSDPYARVTSKFGLAILYTRAYKPGRAGAPLVDPLIRHRVYGEYFKAFQFPLSIMKPTEYRSYMRDVDIFDWNADRWGTLSLRDLVNAWMSFDDAGYIWGSNPTDGRYEIKKSDSGKMNRVFGTFDSQGWRIAKVYGEMVEEFLQDDFLSAQIDQILRPNEPGHDWKATLENIAVAGKFSIGGLNTAITRITGNVNKILNAPVGTGANVPATNAMTGIAVSLTPQAFGYVKQSSVTTTAPAIAIDLNVDQLHDKNLETMKTLSVSLDGLTKYTTVRNMKDIDQTGFAKRTAEVLSSGDLSKINDLLLTPLDQLTQKRTPARATELIGTLTTPEKSTVQTTPATAPIVESTTSKLGFYDVTADFVPVSVHTLQEIPQPESFDLSTPTGFLNYIAACELIQRSNIGVELRSYAETAAPVLNRVSALKNWNAQPLVRRVVKLFQKYISPTNTNFTGAFDPSNNVNHRKYLAGSILCMSQLCKDFFHALIDNDVYFPLNAIIARPWVTTQTATGILGKGGAGLGANMVGHEDTMWADDANTKMHIVTFTMNHRTIIWNPLQITLRSDLWVRQYTGGANLTPFTLATLKTMRTYNFRAGCSFDRQSWLPIFTPVGIDTNDIIDIRGRFDGEQEDTQHFITTSNHYDFFQSAQPNNNPMGSTETTTATYNTAMVQGTQMCYNHVSRQNDAVIMGVSHPLGADTYEGCRKDLERCAKPLLYQGYEQKPKYKIWK